MLNARLIQKIVMEQKKKFQLRHFLMIVLPIRKKKILFSPYLKMMKEKWKRLRVVQVMN